MRGKVGADSRARPGIVALALAAGCLLPLTPASAQMRDTVWLAVSSASHDALANCLAKAMSGEFVAAPVVFAPPKRAAYVNLWPRAQQSINPVATFHVEQDNDGKSRIGWQRLTEWKAGARWDTAAKAVANRCAAASR